MFVTVQRENIRPSKKEMNKTVTILIIKFTLPDVCSQESVRLLIAEQLEVFRPPACSVLPPALH
jgi:hypothetical protein